MINTLTNTMRNLNKLDKKIDKFAKFLKISASQSIKFNPSLRSKERVLYYKRNMRFYLNCIGDYK